MFGKLFSGKKEPQKTYGPTDPIFPGEEFVGSEINDENGFYGISIVNQAYNNYYNKKYYGWCAQITIEFQDKNENDLPTDSEAKILNDMEDEIEAFLNRKHTVHFIGRVTKKDYRDIIFYLSDPKFNKEEFNSFFDELNAIRRLNFSLEKDLEWELVSGLIE
ncbi:MAG: DUF695 domain-containing protein [Flavobacteriales bacterium]|nr:DUF695 domain-containing protein [Flavobacteriales bacterium]